MEDFAAHNLNAFLLIFRSPNVMPAESDGGNFFARFAECSINHFIRLCHINVLPFRQNVSFRFCLSSQNRVFCRQ